jgi:predicted RND superfamily exporter protein
MVAGILGWAGVDLKMTTSIIFTIVFGIAVDDTIHMMSYFIRSKAGPYNERLLDTFRHAGRAMVITTLIVVAGFGLFMMSDFGATYYLGLFVSLSLIDLTVLPLLLKYIHPKPPK